MKLGLVCSLGTGLCCLILITEWIQARSFLKLLICVLVLQPGSGSLCCIKSSLFEISSLMALSLLVMFLALILITVFENDDEVLLYLLAIKFYYDS